MKEKGEEESQKMVGEYNREQWWVGVCEQDAGDQFLQKLRTKVADPK